MATQMRSMRMDDETWETAEQLAAVRNISDGVSGLLRTLIKEEAERAGVPTGSALKAYTSTGGMVTLRKLDNATSGGATNLNQPEFEAYQRARLQADPRNGGDMAKARATLEAAGFEVYWA